jgi:type IV secretory pathway component VirB8
MSLYAEYIKERENFETIEFEDSFLTYEIDSTGTVCHICDLYIRPDKRKNGKEYLKLARQVIKEIEFLNIEKLICSVVKNLKLTNYVLNIHKKTGWVYDSENEEKFFLQISLEKFKERFE